MNSKAMPVKTFRDSVLADLIIEFFTKEAKLVFFM
jgi:hypothetical protein